MAGDRIGIRLLGAFALLDRSGQELVIASKKARGVLAYLALARGQSASREQIASLFWPASADKEARQSLRQSLSALRKALGPEAGEWILTEAGQVALAPDRFDVDVERVLAAVSSDDPAQQLEAARHARGVLLPDHVFGDEGADDWLRDERSRLQDACRRFLFRCAQQRAEEHEVAVELYWQLLTLDPACEEAHRGLMQSYARAGQRSSALAHYRICEDALARHLDAQPSASTRRLYEELLSSESSSLDHIPVSAPGVALGFRGEPASREAPTRESAPTLPLPSKPAIVVLAFANLCGDQSKDYLCDGISEDITTFLSQFSSLYVMSRTTAFALKGKSLSVPEIGRQLGVHYVLEGSVRLAGETIRVTAQLSEAEHGGQVWANRYDGSLQDLFGFQDDISQRIVATTAGRIEAEALDRARRKAATDLDAYDYVLRGKYHHHRCTPEDSETAVKLFKSAVERDPSWPLAKGWLACALGRASSFGQTRTKWMNSSSYKELLDLGFTMMEEGEAIDQEESECLRLLGEVHLFRRNYDEAERYFRRAHRFNPNDDRILSQLSAFFTYCEEPEEAVRHARLAMRLNPFHPGFYRFNLGRALVCLGRYEEAAREISAAAPTQNHWRPYLAACYAALDQAEAAAAVREAIFAAEPGFCLDYLKATMLFRSEARIEELFALMERAGLPRQSAGSAPPRP